MSMTKAKMDCQSKHQLIKIPTAVLRFIFGECVV